jgi:hypothetical protein
MGFSTQERLNELLEFLKRDGFLKKDFGTESLSVRFIYDDPSKQSGEGTTEWYNLSEVTKMEGIPADAKNVYSYRVETIDYSGKDHGGFNFLFDRERKAFILTGFRPGKNGENNVRLFRLCGVNLGYDKIEREDVWHFVNLYSLEFDEEGYIYPEKENVLVYQSNLLC